MRNTITSSTVWLTSTAVCRCARRSSNTSECWTVMSNVTARQRDTSAVSVAKASTTPLTSSVTYARIQVDMPSIHRYTQKCTIEDGWTARDALFSTQASVPTSAPFARRPSPSAAHWSPIWRRSTASPRRMPTRSAATSCTCARSAATRRRLRMICSCTCTCFIPTVTCWKGRQPGGQEEENLLWHQPQSLHKALKVMFPMDRQTSRRVGHQDDHCLNGPGTGWGWGSEWRRDEMEVKRHRRGGGLWCEHVCVNVCLCPYRSGK